MLYRFEDRYVQLEVDENGHEDKSCADEDSRLELIAADVGLPGLVVRLNPDHDGCFGWKRLRNGESCVFVRNTAAYEGLIQSAAAAIDGFISRSEPVGVRTLGLPLDWWTERG
jgi:ribosomal protein L30/L7E